MYLVMTDTLEQAQRIAKARNLPKFKWIPNQEPARQKAIIGQKVKGLEYLIGDFSYRELSYLLGGTYNETLKLESCDDENIN